MSGFDGKLVPHGDGYTALVDDTGQVVCLYKDGCAFCERMKDQGETFFPSHEASSGCRSGGHPHCTCDTCF